MLLVDANNVLHASGDAGSPDGVVRLMEAVLRSRYGSREVVLVCDGAPGRLSPGAQAVLVRLLAGRSGARVVYSGPEREADDVIEAMLAAAAEPRSVTLVSSDARLVAGAYHVGAASVGSSEFVAHLEKDRTKAVTRGAAREEGLDAGSVAWWLEYFGMDGEGGHVPRAKPPRTLRPTEAGPSGPLEAPRFNAARDAGKKKPGVRAPSTDWLTEAARMWPGVEPGELDMERILKEHGPAKKRRKKT